MKSGFIILWLVLIQHLLQPYSYELVGVSGYVGLYYFIPLGIELTAFNYAMRSLRNHILSRMIIALFGVSSVNYFIGMCAGFAYDSDLISESLMNAFEVNIALIENGLGMAVVSLVMASSIKNKDRY